jgi:hypothetical protein
MYRNEQNNQLKQYRKYYVLDQISGTNCFLWENCDFTTWEIFFGTCHIHWGILNNYIKETLLVALFIVSIVVEVFQEYAISIGFFTVLWSVLTDEIPSYFRVSTLFLPSQFSWLISLFYSNRVDAVYCDHFGKQINW